MRTRSILRLYLATIIMAISLGACAETINTKNTSSNVSVKNYAVEQFNRIKSETVANIIFTQGKDISLRAEGRESEIENLEITFHYGELKLKSKIKNKKDKVNNLKIFITAPDLVKIDQEGVGTFTLKDKIVLKNLEIDYEGVGNLVADDLNCQNLKAEYQGVGNMKLKGSAVKADLETEGVGNIDAKDFDVEYLTLKASGVGSVKCSANKSIDISSDGVGSVTYWGDAELKIIIKSGVGKVSKGK